MNAVPQIAVPRGVLLVPGHGYHIDSGWAWKLAKKLVELVRLEERATMQALATMRERGNASGLASVKAQKRLYERASKAMKYTSISSFLSPGNRRRFQMSFIRLAIKDGDGEDARLLLIQNRYTGSPTGVERKAVVLMEFAPHTIQRLIQRAGIVSVDAVVAVLRENWPVLYFATAALRLSKRAAWVVPVRAETGIGYLIVKSETDKGALKLVAVTFVRPEMTPNKKNRRARLEELYAKVEALTTIPADGEIDAESAMDQCVRLFDDAALALGVRESED
jgi:hypothetical protein